MPAVIVLTAVLGSLLLAESPRSFNRVVSLETTSETSANASMGDLDGDGDLDIVLAKGRHDPLIDRVLLNDGQGGFTATNLGPDADRTYTAALADVDIDGDLDVLTSNDTPDRKLVFLNNGKAQFSVAGTWGLAAWSTRNAAVADLNGDGRPDVVAANRPGPSYVCLNLGGGRFQTDCLSLPAKSATTIVPGDFDGDGDTDLAVPARDGGPNQIFFNDGKAGFARVSTFGPEDNHGRVGAAADFDGNGSTDLMVGDEIAKTMTVYLNDGKAALSAAFRFDTATQSPYAGTAGDLNRDGSPDIVFGFTEGPHLVFFNDGSGRAFNKVTFGDPSGSAYGFAVGDINQDGFPDIALARSGAPNVLYLSGK